MSAPADPTGVIPPDALRYFLVTPKLERPDPTGVVPIGPGSFTVLTPLLMDPLTDPKKK